MKTKSFNKYIEKRLSKEEIKEIEHQAKLEAKIFESIQESVLEALDNYMEKNKIGFNELVRRLDSSPAQIAKIQKGKANLTVESLAHLFALMAKEPHEVFKKKK